MIKVKRLFVTVLLMLLLSGCAETEEKNVSFSSGEKDIVYTLKTSDDSSTVQISDESLSYITDYLNSIEVDFVYNDLYETEEVIKRLDTDINISEHKYSALDSDGSLTADSLYQCVIKNNEEFFNSLESGEFSYEEIEADYLFDICKLVVDAINSVLDKYPDIDRERVYCNLGNLKIVYNVTTLDFANVTSELVMNVSENMLTASEVVNGEHSTMSTLIHESMHIIQIGCECEDIPDCSRRSGVVQYCEDFSLNTTDFKWLPEASAERMSCNLTGLEPISYTYAVNYLCSLNLATMLQDDVPANYLETICFYDDINKLYDLFGCETEADKAEVLNLFISIDIIQQQPEPLMQAYGEKYGVNVEDEAVTSDLFCTLKPGICLTMTKHFYSNLLNVLAERDDVSLNDFCYLIGLFESVLDSHMKISKQDYDKYNTEFKETYMELRTKVFDCINAENEVDPGTYYSEYSILDNSTEEQDVNASFKWLDEDKREFLLERAGALGLNLDKKI